MRQGAQTEQDRPSTWIPAEPGLWVLIFGDMLVFALFFATFAYYRLQQPALFEVSQLALNQRVGLLNTMFLLTSSWLVANAVQASRGTDTQAASRWATGGMILGGFFIVTKIVEYVEKVRAGITPATNDFFMLYFVFTGIHLVHVAIGLLALAILRSRIAKPVSAARSATIEGCAIFWHMVDVLWVALFAIMYLHR